MPYEKFKAWQLCHALALEVYRITRDFPADERFALTSQARRAAFSAAANIAEGAMKRGTKEFRRYLNISLGSLGELRYIIQLASDLRYVSPVSCSRLIGLHTEANKTTWALYSGMDNR